jgi:hypothetical protein
MRTITDVLDHFAESTNKVASEIISDPPSRGECAFSPIGGLTEYLVFRIYPSADGIAEIRLNRVTLVTGSRKTELLLDRGLARQWVRDPRSGRRTRARRMHVSPGLPSHPLARAKAAAATINALLRSKKTRIR